MQLKDEPEGWDDHIMAHPPMTREEEYQERLAALRHEELRSIDREFRASLTRLAIATVLSCAALLGLCWAAVMGSR